MICPSVPHQSERLEPAQALSLDVDKGTLGAALDFYTKGELLEGDNQYYCEAVGAKVLSNSLITQASPPPLTPPFTPLPLMTCVASHSTLLTFEGRIRNQEMYVFGISSCLPMPLAYESHPELFAKP